VLTDTAGCQIAAVKQDVAGIGKGVGPQCNLGAVLLQRICIQSGVTELDAAIAAVGNDVNGIDVVLLLELSRNLLDAVLVTIQHDDFYVSTVIRVVLHVIDKLLKILDTGIDEDNLTRDLLGLRSGLVVSFV
jgi:hypothetical protein